MLQKRKSRSGLLNPCVGLGLIGNLTLSAGLIPWLALSAHGQAVLLETNPTPDTPSFDIPSAVEAAPEPVAPEVPDVAYEPEPYVAPAPEAFVEPAPYFEPEPYVAPAPNIVPEPAGAPNGYEPTPYVEAPEPIVQPAPIKIAPATGCAALLDPTMGADVGCGTAPIETEVAPASPRPAAPIIANEDRMAPVQANIPPARQVQTTPAVPSMPPARRLTAVSSVAHSSPNTPRPVVPTTLPPVPTYRNSVVASTMTVPPPLSASATPATPPSPPPMTVVQSERYALKPLNARNPLQWILGSQPMLFPLPIPVAVSSAFGWRQHPIHKSWHLHSGMDFAAPQGTPVVAAFDGQVAIADRVGGYGLTVLLSHNQGERQTRYAHLSQIFVKPGQTVSQGDVLGSVGSTGNSTGPHLHFETLIKTPEGMVVVDPTVEVKAALINTLERMQAIAQNKDVPVIDADLKEQTAPAIESPPIPVEVIQPMSRYQASTSLSVPLLTE